MLWIDAWYSCFNENPYTSHPQIKLSSLRITNNEKFSARIHHQFSCLPIDCTGCLYVRLRHDVQIVVVREHTVNADPLLGREGTPGVQNHIVAQHHGRGVM